MPDDKPGHVRGEGDRIPIRKLDLSSPGKRVRLLVIMVGIPVGLLLTWWAFAHFLSFAIIMGILLAVALIIFLIYICPIIVEWVVDGDWDWYWWG